jgi:hypothetical protein
MTNNNDVDNVELWLMDPNTTFEEIDSIANGDDS